MINTTMLAMIAAFEIFLGVLFVMMASKQVKDDAHKRRIPPERAQILALIFFVGGVGLFAYVLYIKAFG